ncbi:MAG: hypothetical protein ACOZHQ_06240 [Thermodesulfobacteriota bacterium]
MRNHPRTILRRFYDQALLSPELLCLHCAHSAWTGAVSPCPSDRRQDCQIYVSDMLQRLSNPAQPSGHAARRPQEQPQPRP